MDSAHTGESWYGDSSIDNFGTPGQWSSSVTSPLGMEVREEVPPPVPPPPPAKVSWSKLASTLRESNVRKIDPLPASLQPPMREADRPGNTICSFFMSGELCRYGEFCRFRHVKPEPWAVEYFERVLTERLAETRVLQPEEEGGDREGGGGGVEPSPEFSEESEAWQSSVDQTAILRRALEVGVVDTLDAAEVALGAAERGMSRDVECGICLQQVVDVPGRRFGLLTGCSHPFCLECIRTWRARIDLPSSTVRACPLCRVLSYLVIPCDRFVVDEGRKASINAEYSAGQRTIPCRHWDQGRGVCPFGNSCHYAHLLPDGQPAPSRKYDFLLNADGKAQGVGGKRKMADFIFTSSR